MTEQMTLLPCPFCRGENTRHFNSPDELGRPSHGIQCANGDCWISGPQCETEEQAIAAWNRRVPAPAVPDDVAETQAENYRLRSRNASLQAAREEQDRANKAQRATIEAQAAELARLKAELTLQTKLRDANVRLRFAAEAERDREKERADFWAEAVATANHERDAARAALTHPTGGL